MLKLSAATNVCALVSSVRKCAREMEQDGRWRAGRWRVGSARDARRHDVENEAIVGNEVVEVAVITSHGRFLFFKNHKMS